MEHDSSPPTILPVNRVEKRERSPDMAIATVVDVAVGEPPTSSPHLGNFSLIFDAFLKLQSDSEHKIELKPKLPTDQEASKKTSKKVRQQNKLSKTPENRGEGKDTDTGSLYEDRLSVKGSGKTITYNTPARFSDATLNLTSGGSVQYSTSSTSPPTLDTPDKTPRPFDSIDIFRSTTSHLSKVTKSIISPAHGQNDTPRASISTVEKVFASSRYVANGYQFVTSPPVLDSPATNVTFYSSTSRFQYQEFKKQPYHGVKLYQVVGPGSHDIIIPRYMASKEDKVKVLNTKLAHLFKDDEAMKKHTNVAANPVHIFIDLSNITIGFFDSLKAARGIPAHKRPKAPPFSFDNLACVLERGRVVDKKVVAGSLVHAYDRKWPQYMQEAKDLDYEMNILQRVPKVSPTRKRPRRGNGNGTGTEPEWTTSGADTSGDDTMFAGELKQGEQGVDELLHLKMLQSALDSKPGTAILATGDAAEAEYSDGFKKNVERLLQMGWNIEIIGWSKGISSAWHDRTFRQLWAERVRVIELDDFSEELFGAWFGAKGY